MSDKHVAQRPWLQQRTLRNRTSARPLVRVRLTLLAALAAFVALGAVSVPSDAADRKDELRHQQNSVQKKLNAAQSDADESNAKLLAASRAVSRANARLKVARGKLSAIRGKLAVAKAIDQRLRAELAEAEAELAKSEARLTKVSAQVAESTSTVEQFAVESVISNNRGLRTFGKLLAGSSAAELAQTEAFNNTIGDAQLATMQHLDAMRVMSQVQEHSAQKLRDKVAAKKAEAARNVAAMAALTAKAEAQTDSVEKLLVARAQVRAHAQKLADEDMRRVAQYEAERKRVKKRLAAVVARELAKARAKARKSGKSGKTSRTSRATGTGSGDSGGTLSYPVNGPITSPYGMRFHPLKHIWKLHDGTDFGVACGTPVHAAAGGTIIQQYYNSAYGNRLLLNNGVKRGVSVITIYNHLSSFKYSTGRRVSRGDVIAYSGTTGLSTGCHLHFMVLVNGNAVNPMGWL